MTVAELIEELKTKPQNLRVLVILDDASVADVKGVRFLNIPNSDIDRYAHTSNIALTLQN